LPVFETRFGFEDLKKGIVGFLMGDVGDCGVWGDEGGMLGEEEEFGGDIMDEVGVVAGGEVGSGYGLVKE
uniref:hypothetical protein n=1 Tax=Neisseria sicca TaxID=490 RepID=UPI001C998C42